MINLNLGSLRYEISGTKLEIKGLLSGLFKSNAPIVHFVSMRNNRVAYARILPDTLARERLNEQGFYESLKLSRSGNEYRSFSIGLLFFCVALTIFLAFQNQNIWIYASPSILIAIVLVALATAYDALGQNLIILFKLDNDAQEHYKNLISAFEYMKSNQRIWILKDYTYNDSQYLQKINAGAGRNIERDVCQIKFSLDSLSTNMPIASVNSPQVTILFLPNVIIRYSKHSLFILPYRKLERFTTV